MTMKEIAKPNRYFIMGVLNYWLVVGITIISLSVLFAIKPSRAADVEIYKSPYCGCCNDWVRHMQENGFSVEVHNLRNMNPVKSDFGVPRHLQSCHTAMIGGYVVEGHVPAHDITRLLSERPKVTGLAVPGMPMGSPGMDGPRKAPFDVLIFQSDGKTSVYSSYNQ